MSLSNWQLLDWIYKDKTFFVSCSLFKFDNWHFKSCQQTFACNCQFDSCHFKNWHLADWHKNYIIEIENSAWQYFKDL